MNGLLGRVERLVHTLAIGANVLGTLFVLCLVAIINSDVVARGLFNAPFRGTVEIVQFSMVLIVFLQLPDVIRVNRLTRSDGLFSVLARRRPMVERYLRRAIDLLSAAFMTVVAVSIWPEFVEMFETGDYFGIPGVFTAPWWPIKLVIFVSAVLCAIIFALKCLRGSDGSSESASADDELLSDVGEPRQSLGKSAPVPGAGPGKTVC